MYQPETEYQVTLLGRRPYSVDFPAGTPAAAGRKEGAAYLRPGANRLTGAELTFLQAHRPVIFAALVVGEPAAARPAGKLAHLGRDGQVRALGPGERPPRPPAPAPAAPPAAPPAAKSAAPGARTRTPRRR